MKYSLFFINQKNIGQLRYVYMNIIQQINFNVKLHHRILN